MGFCPKCGAQVADGAPFCASCGAPLGAAPAAAANPYDHTAEFDAKDISENKCVALLPYLLSAVGIIVIALLSNSSEYVKFHLHQAIKFLVVDALICFCLIVPILGWIFAPIALLVSFVLKIIVVFQIFGGKAIEPPIIRELGFLK
ncbi:MAG: zinc-ribbon domain-containing protein [Lachnospiraceae bacterium]|nr:zinc-ribbon domain-containing protein [Lachnospiraceae bacterium]